jgi:hypothetical protein
MGVPLFMAKWRHHSSQQLKLIRKDGTYTAKWHSSSGYQDEDANATSSSFGGVSGFSS